MNKMTRTIAALAAIGLVTACTDLVTKEVDSKVIKTDASGATNVSLKRRSITLTMLCKLLLIKPAFIP